MAPSRVRIPPSPLAQRPPRFCAHPRRGGRAVECGGLENRYPSLGGSRVQIPPPPLLEPNPTRAIESGAPHRCLRARDRVARHHGQAGPVGKPQPGLSVDLDHSRREAYACHSENKWTSTRLSTSAPTSSATESRS